MKNLAFLLTALLIISCNRGISDSLDEPQQLNGSWDLVSILGTEVQISPEEDGLEQPRLDIQAEEMKYSGKDGCNSFMGGLTELDGVSLSFGIAAGTRRMCIDMDLPDQFMGTMGQVKSYKLMNQTLRLYDESGKELMRLISSQ